jgi:hypothetical protein
MSESTERQKAQLRFDELHAEASAEFRARPFAERGDVTANPQAYTPDTIEAWYRQRGVEISVVGKFLDGLLTSVIALAPHACQECGHVGGEHREGCSVHRL